MEEGKTVCQFDVRGGRYETLGFIIKKGVEYTLFQFSKFSCPAMMPALCAFRTGFNEIVFTIRGDDTEHEIYKLLLQNGARGINVASGMFNL